MRQSAATSRERGFSLLEMMVTLAILTTVMGVVFVHLADTQKKYKSEETKMDMTQETRAFMDEIARDLRQAGYPSLAMFDTGQSPLPSQTSNYVAQGLLSYDYTDLQFEGDVDGDGTVNVLHYALADDGSGNCPCTLKRSQRAKGTTTEISNLEVQNIVNSTSSSPKSITGTTPSGNTSVSNDTLYAAYKTPSIFQAFDKSGNAVNPTSDATVLKTIRTIRVTLNVLAPQINLDTRTRPVVSMSVNARVGNNL